MPRLRRSRAKASTTFSGEDKALKESAYKVAEEVAQYGAVADKTHGGGSGS